MIFHDVTETRSSYLRAFLIVMALFAGVTLFHFQSIITTSYAVQKTSATSTVSTEKKLVLTFDDGPSPIYTKDILEILQRYEVPAVFFVVGHQVAAYPDIVKEIVDAGHEIGNHTYSHQYEVHENNERIRRELFTTNRLIEHATGHRTFLYRPPFLLDISSHPKEYVLGSDNIAASPLSFIQSLGFVSVGAYIDSKDFEASSVKEVYGSLMSQVEDGNIILFHDGGGDRSLTVEALPYIIEAFEADGYEFVSFAELSGRAPVEVMSPVELTFLSKTVGQMERVALMGVGFTVVSVVPFIITMTLIFSIFRIIFLLTLVVSFKAGSPYSTWRGGVSILVPAYNEENNILGTLQSILESTHHPREIIVVDDGSRDRTAEVVQQFSDQNPHEQIVLIHQENGGKAAALNTALSHATYEVLVAIDGDTVIDKNAVAILAAHFNDVRVGAVAGKVMALGNKLLHAFQNLEYTVGQNIDKSALASIGALGVIPGAVGAFKRRDVLEVGGYSSDTLVEDQDLTFALHSIGKHIHYEPRAKAYTEVPSNTKSFIKQRFRWVFGSLQCLFKYRTQFFNKNNKIFGWLLLPYNLIYIAIVPLLSLIIMAVTLILIISKEWNILGVFMVFLIIDILFTLISLLFEPKKLYLLVIIPFQRIYYQITITIIIILCLARIIAGTRTYWNKLERFGIAQLYFERQRPIVIVPNISLKS